VQTEEKLYSMTNQSMLPVLDSFKKALPKLLENETIWNSLYVDYSAPLVERVWQPFDEGRGFLHTFHTCKYDESLYHKHNWPSGMEVVSGSYEMGIGHGIPGDDTPPPITTRIILVPGCRYEMIDPDEWHYVLPLEENTRSIMVTGKPWGTGAPKSVYTLRTLNDEELKRMFDFFRSVCK
jgi:hypothetical protein